jgi:N-acetyl-gamma-glutamyl-phosphate reductase
MKTNTKKISAAICGASGYTGSELLRILTGHPLVTVSAVTSERSAGKKVSEIFPAFLPHTLLTYEPLRKEKVIKKADVFFLALPHGASQEAVNFFYEKGKRVIDLSADYRLTDRSLYKKWYGIPHEFPSTLQAAVYGLPELFKQTIKKAQLIANPGCYPTGALLGLLPAVKHELIDVSSVIIDSKSGTSGAGRKSDLSLAFCEVNEGFKAYSVGSHRHTPEIEQILSSLARKDITVNFTPHLLPVDRGILTTMYAPLKKKISEGKLFDIYQASFKKEPFIMVYDKGLYPNILNVRSTNFCHIGLKVNKRTNTLIIVTAIDNLVKGAAGQAVQNMNIMLGFEETTGLQAVALHP